jgi:hypothetical protein
MIVKSEFLNLKLNLSSIHKTVKLFSILILLFKSFTDLNDLAENLFMYNLKPLLNGWIQIT